VAGEIDAEEGLVFIVVYLYVNVTESDKSAKLAR
jgi:hypothetical protein